MHKERKDGLIMSPALPITCPLVTSSPTGLTFSPAERLLKIVLKSRNDKILKHLGNSSSYITEQGKYGVEHHQYMESEKIGIRWSVDKVTGSVAYTRGYGDEYWVNTKDKADIIKCYEF